MKSKLWREILNYSYGKHESQMEIRMFFPCIGKIGAIILVAEIANFKNFSSGNNNGLEPIQMLSLIHISNPSITQMDMNGAEWLLNFKNSATNSVYIMSPVYRFLAGSLGHVEAGKLFGSSYKEANITDHFNYTISKNLGNSYTQNEYFMMTMFDKIVYETVWNVVGRFHHNDFKELEGDTSVDRLYSNGDTLSLIHI